MPAVKFNPAGVGQWSGELEFEVTAERIVEYAKATNDPIEQHLSGEAAPPVFAIVPVFDSLIPAALSVAPPEVMAYILHGEQDFRFHRQIRPGMTLVSKSKPIGYEGRENGTPCAVYIECRDKGSGDLVNEQWVTFFVRKRDAGETVGELAPAHSFDESLREQGPVAKVVQHVDDDQTFRYGPAAGDPMPIHLDEDAAKLAGLPGIIAHGLCTMAFTSWAVINEVADGKPERLRRLAVRFSKPVFPGQDITTEIYRVAGSAEPATPPGGGATRYAYETFADGEAVVKDGLAEITD